MEERRKMERKYLIIYSRVFNRGSGQLLGYLADMSRLGMMIISENHLPENATIPVRIDLPDTKIFKADHIKLMCRVAWCRPDLDPSFYNVGFEFQDPTPEDLEIIQIMIDEYEFRREMPDYPIAPSMLDNE